MYLKYIGVTNRIILCYEHIAQPQKRIYLKKLVEACIGRVLELKHDLVALETSEFQFLDHMLLSLRMVPKDMDLKIPEHFKERTEEEGVLKQIVERNINKMLEKEREKYVVSENMKFVRTAMVYIRLLQAHERTRQATEEFHEHQKRYIVKELNIRKEARKEMEFGVSRQSAAITIQRAFRLHLLRKSLKKEYAVEMKFLRMLPLPQSNFAEDLEKDRLRVIKRNHEEYQKMKNYIKMEMMTYKVPQMMENLEDRIRSYFEGFFVLYGKYPEFPDEEEGGSTKMFETSVEFDGEEIEPTEGAETKSETKKDSKSQKEAQSSIDSKSTKDSKSSKATTKGKDGKDKGSKTDVPEGYSLKPSQFLEDLISLNEEYQTVWSIKALKNFDRFDPDMLKDDVTKEVELEVRLKVDEKMRLELSRLTEAFQKDSKKKAKKKSKGKKKGKSKDKKVKKEKDLTPDRTVESLIEELVSESIIVAYPKFYINDFIGDYNYSGSAQNLAGDSKNHPYPCLGDVKRVITEYCTLPMGSQEIHAKGAFVKSLLIAGPKGVGKKSLIYAACNEINATMIDLSAENIEGKYPGKEGKEMLLHLVLKVGRLLQPTVIFINNAENYFYKKKPATCTLSEPGRLKKDLPKFVKGIRNEDRIMVCGTATLPFDVDLKGLGSSYNKVICILKPDYNCRRSLWREFIIKNKGILTRKLDMTVLCNVSDGFTAASIESSVKEALTNRRVTRQKKIPLCANDFLIELSNHVPVYEEENEAYKQWLEKMPLSKKRTALLDAEIDETVTEEDESEEED